MEHSNVFSFSASSRLIPCTGSRRMSKGQPNLPSPSSELGTAAHGLGEHCLRFGFEPSECEGLTFNKHKVDSNMFDAVSVYTGKIRTLELELGVRGLLEQRVTMSSLGRTDVFGTSDYINICLPKRKVYIVDYKHGYGVVEVEGNTQLIAYGIATLDTYNLWGLIDEVVLIVVQPRASHIDGPIREITYSVEELRNVWWQKYYDAVKSGEEPNSPIVAGSHCVYCPARGYCRKRIEQVLSVVYNSNEHTDNLSDNEIEVLYNELGNIKTNIDAIERRAIDIAKTGRVFKDYKLVNSIVRGQCKDEESFIKEVVEKVGNEKVENLYNKKLVGMTAAKKLVGKALVDKYYVKPPAGVTLVRMTDSRPAKGQPKSAQGIFGSII